MILHFSGYFFILTCTKLEILFSIGYINFIYSFIMEFYKFFLLVIHWMNFYPLNEHLFCHVRNSTRTLEDLLKSSSPLWFIYCFEGSKRALKINMDSWHFFIYTNSSHCRISVPQGPFHILVKVLSDKSTQITSVNQMSLVLLSSAKAV